MLRVKIIFRFFKATLAVLLPFTVLGFLIFENKGILLGALAGCLGVAVIVFFSEALVARAFKPQRQEFKGLDRTLLAVVSEVGGSVPRLLVYSDPSPDALALCSLGGRGTILLSQGLIGLVSEEELRVILRLCLKRVRQPGAVLQSLCSVLVAIVMLVAPSAWVNLVFSGRALTRLEEYSLSPLSSIGFIILFPVVRFFLKLGQLPVPKNGALESQNAYLTAMQKIVTAVHVLGVGRSQRSFSLFSPRT